MRRHRFADAALLASTLAAVACADPAEPAEGRDPGLVARGVTLEVPAGDQTLRARGDRLELADDREEVILVGDARVELDGPARIEARAERLRVRADGPQVELHGRVRATFTLPETGAGDAGP